MEEYKNYRYDIIMVGAGPANIICAYKLITERPELRILIIEKGKSIKNRNCIKKKNNKCEHCNICSLTSGFGGAAVHSSGKLTLSSSEIGGDFYELVGEAHVKDLITEVDSIYTSFGASGKVYGIDSSTELRNIRTKAIRANMKLVENPIKDLTNPGMGNIYNKIEDFLVKNNVEILYDTLVVDLIVHRELTKLFDRSRVSGIVTDSGERYFASKIVIGTGVESSKWFNNMCSTYGIKTSPGNIDLGIRIECRSELMDELNSLYESKLVYRTKKYNDKVRTYNQNPLGNVVVEHPFIDDNVRLTTVTGKPSNKPNSNTNFAILVTQTFTEPFKDTNEYGITLARLANMLAGNKVIIQTYGDLKRYRRSTTERLKYGNIKPSLKDAEAGDLSLILPYRIMLDIVEMIEALDNIIPGIANDETLLYGPEIKFYSHKLKLDKACKTSTDNLYCIGDASSYSRGISIASSMGLHLAYDILKNS